MTSTIEPTETRGTDDFVATLRAHSRRYHDQHPFHVRMNAGELSRRQLQGWIANRFYYQENIPRKDAAILSNCPDLEVRRRWIRRIVDHDGQQPGEGGIEAWLRLGVHRTIFVHMNNTNPILLDGTPERRRVEEGGVEVAVDGLEVEV